MGWFRMVVDKLGNHCDIRECPLCGGDMAYDDDEELWYCENCGESLNEDLYEHFKKSGALENYRGMVFDDDKPDECVACDNPAYPDCFNGCDILEDD